MCIHAVIIYLRIIMNKKKKKISIQTSPDQTIKCKIYIEAKYQIKMKTKTTNQENLAIFVVVVVSFRTKDSKESSNKNNDQRATQSINPRLHDHCIHMYV